LTSHPITSRWSVVPHFLELKKDILRLVMM
jgi:hypothetical protein